MQQATLAFIGGGNMAGSLIGGLISDGWNPASIHVADPDPQQLNTMLQRSPDLMVTEDNLAAIKNADAVILAVKPQILHNVSSDLRDDLQANRPLIISIAAGVREADINRWMGGQLPVVRCMPNTPALVQSGATGLFANALVTAEQKALAESILRAAGITVWVDDESLLDAVTALSGSGPAYYFLVMEAMQTAGEKLGLDKETARLLTLQTALAAARLALESQDD
ncbi:MAG TPA: pyrroline-5-carboxylate reductase, partial [Thiotrichales bacterium]|nr:pyrroline-5-carboxylate reductase [Thiotrichales bacterium]